MELNINELYALTVEQASEYFNIGTTKLRKIISDYSDSDWLLMNGNKVLIKRKKFENFLDNITTI